MCAREREKENRSIQLNSIKVLALVPCQFYSIGRRRSCIVCANFVTCYSYICTYIVSFYIELRGREGNVACVGTGTFMRVWSTPREKPFSL